MQERGGSATLVRINPDLPLADDEKLQPSTVSLMGYGLATRGPGP